MASRTWSCKRITALAVSGTVGWMAISGPTTSLGPIDGYYSVGLGAKYNVTLNGQYH